MQMYYFFLLYLAYQINQKTWENTKAYCKSYNMEFLSIESYEEDVGVFTAFGGYESKLDENIKFKNNQIYF